MDRHNPQPIGHTRVPGVANLLRTSWAPPVLVRNSRNKESFPMASNTPPCIDRDLRLRGLGRLALMIYLAKIGEGTDATVPRR